MPKVDPIAAELISAEDAVRLRAVPYAFDGPSLLVALNDPTDFAAADELSIISGRPVLRRALQQDLFDTLLRNAYGATAAQMALRLAGGAKEAEDDLTANLQAVDADDVQRMAEQPSLINLVNLIILEAIKERASDIHVEPFEKQSRGQVPCGRHALGRKNRPPSSLQPAITSRIKIMAGNEHRGAIRAAGRAHLAPVRGTEGGHPRLRRCRRSTASRW